MKHIKLFEQFIKESQEEDIAYDILQDLLGERDPEELEMMDLVDAEDTVMAYGHKGAKAKKIAKALVNLAQSGAFESNVIKESQEEDIAYDILQDLLGERDPEELEMMDLVDAEDTVMAYGHKGAKAKKIAKALVNLAQSGAFESKRTK